MLNAETKKKVAALLRVDEAKLSEALASADEVSVELPELQTFTPDDLAKRDSAKYNEGSKAGVEMAVKKSKETLGLDFEGKSLDSLLKAHGDKVVADAKLPADEWKQKYEKMVEKSQAHDGEREAWAKERDTILREGKIMSAMPKVKGLSQSEAFTLVRSQYEFTEENGVLVAKRGGKTVENATTLQPVPVADVITDYFTKRNLIDAEPAPGRGAGSNPPKGAAVTKMSEAREKWKSEGKHENSAEFSTWVQGLKKANPEFDMSA